jgi:hypothetical protein
MNTPQKISVGFFGCIIIFWSVLFFSHTTTGFYNYLYSFLFGLIPLVGGAFAMQGSRLWGTFKSAIGKAVFFVGLGIFLWGCGETVWSYYNFFLGVPAPYPSLADIGFAPSIFFYGLGAMYLSKATGAKFALRDMKYAKMFIILGPLFSAIFSYYLLVIVARGGVLVPQGETLLKASLDILYPIGDFIGFTISIVVSGLSFKYLGGKYKIDIFSILLGLGVMFVADCVFAYTTTINTYYNADFGDLLLASGLFLLTFGVLGFYNLKNRDA